MTSRALLRAAIAALCSTSSLAVTSAWAQAPSTPAPPEQSNDQGAGEEMGVITVTGSRTITDVLKSPTPITSVDIAELALTTPSDTADALNKLPSIMGGRTPRNQGNGSTNNGGNTLSLRNFGPSRTLVLLDGHRVAPSNQDGSVNIDVLPQMLVKSVDIVTGGASAIYGSDAVAGVVNYVLDKDFTGLTVKADFGMSKYSDGDEYQFGAAWGTSLFSDRGHFEVAARARQQDMIPQHERPYARRWASLVADRQRPARDQPGGRPLNSLRIRACSTAVRTATCSAAPRAPYNNYTFNAAGGLVPMVHGTPSASGGIESGGDGSYIKYGTFRSELDAKDVFARFSLDLGESANWYVQGSWAQAENASDWIQWVVSPNNGRPNTLFANNPYITPATQALAGSGHRLRNSRRNRLALPAGRAADLAANRQHAATAAERAHFRQPALLQ